MDVKNKKLALNRRFIKYIHPLKSITDIPEQKQCWLDQMKFLIEDFNILLKLPYYEFWITIEFTKDAMIGFQTFLREAAPPHLSDHFSQDFDIISMYNEIEHLAYLLLKRLTDENEELTPKYLCGLLVKKNVINIPMLFDLCVIYSHLHTKELEIIIKKLFSHEKLFNENLKSCIQCINKCFSQFQDKIELDLAFDNRPNQNQTGKSSTAMNKANLIIIQDIVDFLLDISYSITGFLEIYPIASNIFYKEKFHLCLASFYHNVKPLIYKRVIMMNKLEQFNEKLHATRLLQVKCVHQCLNSLTEQINTKKESKAAVEEYLETITELLAFNEFVNDYNLVYNLGNSLKKCQSIMKEKDTTRYDYLQKSLALTSETSIECEQLPDDQLELNSNNNLENAKLQSLISDVKDLLPHLGNGFIQLCLEYYDMDSEKVISMVLENSLPLELTQYDFSLASLSLEENSIISDKPPLLNKKLKKLKAVLDDKSFRNEMRPFYEQYNFTEVTSAELESYYDDEYDDTYDEVEYIIPEPADENEKRRQDVTPRVLIQKKPLNECIEEYSSDENSQEPKLNFQPFCENPEVVRERQARKYVARQNNKSNRSKPKIFISSTSGSQTELDRQRKGENKAFQGNHNRRNAARNKQQRGMF
ncbi:activating signal cointegrator 1 complex subunit 2 isoform X2 [Adelges cooleyi]|uniref:activating signal cointegrator 1 complex subunit 2 isoform X2 n=1 Tax=Adelges cooleyi TaxID=133065 RepID=UPI0021808097|nr:activating signal cointegrator 1 complex subunit 2 isoform X2 [Adelges cooleyi]